MNRRKKKEIFLYRLTLEKSNVKHVCNTENLIKQQYMNNAALGLYGYD
jgi:hypothetical protein